VAAAGSAIDTVIHVTNVISSVQTPPVPVPAQQ